MGFHHVALTCRDMDATHRFYTAAMGFELVKVVVGQTPAGGWAKHFFYDTGGQGLIAFWEIHDDPDVKPDWQPGISTGLGLPGWANHLAFEADTAERFDAHLGRWLGHGLDVFEIDHGWCRSIYTNDPSGTMVEFCLTTQSFSDDDRERALAALSDPGPELEAQPEVRLHRAKDRRG